MDSFGAGKRQPHLLAVVLVALVIVAAPHSATAAFSGPSTIISSGGDPFGYPADVGFSAAGDATVAVVGSNKLIVVTRTAGGSSFSGGQLATATKASMAVSSNGAAVIAYKVSATSVGVAYRSPGASFNATAQTYSGTAVGNVAAGIDDNGNAVVAWLDGGIHYAISSGASFGAAQSAPLGSSPGFDGKPSDPQRDYGPRAFIDDAGNVILAYLDGSAPTVAHRSAAGTWDSAVLPGGAATDLTAAGDPKSQHLIVGYLNSGTFRAFVGTTTSSSGTVQVQAPAAGTVENVAVRHGGNEDLALWSGTGGAVQSASCMEGYQTSAVGASASNGLAAAVTSGDDELAFIDAPPGLQRGARTPGGAWALSPYTVTNYGTYTTFGTDYAGNALIGYVDFPSDTAITGFGYSGAASGTPPAASTCAADPTGSGPPPNPSLRPTGTQVSCNYTVATGIDTCGAQVGDGGPQPPAVTPTGTITFTSNPSSAFIGGASCALQPTPLSPQVASCTVDVQLPGAQFPVITATYGGDSQHSGSSGSTSFLIAGGITGLDDNGQTTSDPQTCVDPNAGPALDAFGIARIAQGTGEKIANKICDLVAAGAAGRIAALICTASGPLAETVAVPIGCVVALGVAGFSLKWFLDPADSHYRQLYVAPARTAKLPPCRGAQRAKCAALRPVQLAYLTALDTVESAQQGLATTGDRLTSARAAKDDASILLQTAARKVYVGELATAYATLNKRGAEFAHALKRAGLDVRLTAAQAKSALAAFLKRRAAAVTQAAKASGLSAAAFAKQLKAAVKADRGTGPQTLTKVLSIPVLYKPFLSDYRSLTLDSLRTLVRGLDRGGTIKDTTATTLLATVTCTRSHPAPSVKTFIADVKRKPLPAAYGRLLAFAAAPLVKQTRCV